MTYVNFMPAVWSKVILASLQKKLVYGSPMVVNSDYEGEISGPGNTVHITQFGDPTVSDYTPGGTVTYQALQRRRPDPADRPGQVLRLPDR